MMHLVVVLQQTQSLVLHGKKTLLCTALRGGGQLVGTFRHKVHTLNGAAILAQQVANLGWFHKGRHSANVHLQQAQRASSVNVIQ